MRWRDKRRRRCSSTVGLVCTAMIGLCSMVGVSQAYWNDSVQVTGTINTGNLNVLFVDVPGQSYQIINGRKTLELNLTGLKPSDSPVIIPYRVANEGTIPAQWDAVSDEDLGGIRISTTSHNGGTIDPNTESDGQIRIEIEESAIENHPYDFTLGLNFRQAP